MTSDLEPGTAAPVIKANTGDVGGSFDAYIELQKALDARMPEAIVDISGKKYRTKQFWKTIATAFGVSVELVKEEALVLGDDQGCAVV